MGPLKIIAIFILVISFFTFVAFFGKLPALRHTPIGSLHRWIWIYLPNIFWSLDQRLTHGRLSNWVLKQANTLWNDRHPLVMLFFIAILSVSELAFLPKAWHIFSLTRKVTTVILIALPYLFLYAAAASDPGYVTKENHSHQMTLYPYDFTIFYPGHQCRTCHLLKPARSKHCSLCKHCISKMDHHCIFINNCVGYGNQHWFILLLISTGTLASYATYVGCDLLSATIKAEIPSWTFRGLEFTWSQYFNIWSWALQEQLFIGAVSLLCLLVSPLVWGLLTYHLYLIWAGTTTNESLKWSDWQAEMSDGFVFKRVLPSDRQKDTRFEPSWTRWPAESQQVLQRTDDGLPPTGPGANIGTGDWERVWRLADVENLYDLGFWDNLTDIFSSRFGQENPSL